MSKKNPKMLNDRHTGRPRAVKVSTRDSIQGRTLVDWAATVGMAPTTLQSRLNRGMSLRVALSKPVGKMGERIREVTINGVTKTPKLWALQPEVTVSASTIAKRLHKGWYPHDAVFLGKGKVPDRIHEDVQGEAESDNIIKGTGPHEDKNGEDLKGPNEAVRHLYLVVLEADQAMATLGAIRQLKGVVTIANLIGLVHRAELGGQHA